MFFLLLTEGNFHVENIYLSEAYAVLFCHVESIFHVSQNVYSNVCIKAHVDMPSTWSEEKK